MAELIPPKSFDIVAAAVVKTRILQVESRRLSWLLQGVPREPNHITFAVQNHHGCVMEGKDALVQLGRLSALVQRRVPHRLGNFISRDTLKLLSGLGFLYCQLPLRVASVTGEAQADLSVPAAWADRAGATALAGKGETTAAASWLHGFAEVSWSAAETWS